MKSIRTTTIAIAGAALLALGALTGCSSDSDDKGSDTKASDESKDDSTSDDDSKDDSTSDDDSKDAASFDFDCDEYTTAFAKVDPPTDMTDMDAVADYYDDLAAEASGGLKNALEAIADATRNPTDTAAVERAADATEAWTSAAMECAGM